MWLIFIIMGCVLVGALDWYGNWEYYQSPTPWRTFITVDPACVYDFKDGMWIEVNDYTAVVVAKVCDDGVIEIEGVS